MLIECTLSMTESTNTHKCSYIYISNTYNVFKKYFRNFYFIDLYQLNDLITMYNVLFVQNVSIPNFISILETLI